MRIDIPALTADEYTTDIDGDEQHYVIVRYAGNDVGYFKTGYLGYDAEERKQGAESALADKLVELFKPLMDGANSSDLYMRT